MNEDITYKPNSIYMKIRGMLSGIPSEEDGILQGGLGLEVRQADSILRELIDINAETLKPDFWNKSYSEKDPTVKVVLMQARRKAVEKGGLVCLLCQD